MTLKIGLNLIKNYSINFDTPARNKKSIKFILIHYTGMKNEKSAIKRLCDHKSKVSSHYFIKKNGTIINMVPDNYIAWHAGKSCWKNYKSLNKNSIGIEISNPGHDHAYKNFSKQQIKSILILLKKLVKNYKIKAQNILGHSDVAPNRKKDPGEKFPWKMLAKNRLSIWHNLKEKKIKNFRKIRSSSKDEKKFIKNLSKIGYCKLNIYSPLKNKKYVTEAFQRRFRQTLINGIIDKECILIAKNLLKT